MSPATAPVIDWDNDVGGVLMMLLQPPPGDPKADETDDNEEEVDGAAFRGAPVGGMTDGGAGTEADEATGRARNEEDRLLGILGTLEDGTDPPTKTVCGGMLAPFFILSKFAGAT